MATPLRPIRRTITHPRRLPRQIQRGLRLVRPNETGEASPMRDVWTVPKYRPFAIAYLIINIILFVGLGCFTYWLRTGDFTPFSEKPYAGLLWKAFNPTGSEQITLTDFLLRPIPVDQVPLMLVIVSLVLAALTTIPLLVSMLYGFSYSLPFTIILAFVAVFPWLAITVTFCCYLARLRALRFSFRLATALIAYLPVIAYYALAVGDKAASAHLTPLEVAKLYLPWVLALAFAFVLMGLVLLIARLVNYRPGAIMPLMIVTFALPVALFEGKVGRDELYYRLLQEKYAPGVSEHFPDRILLDDLVPRIAEMRLETHSPVTAADQIALEIQLRAASGQPQIPEILTLVHDLFANRQHEAVSACEAFRRHYPASRYIPNVLYMQGQALDTRVDPDMPVFRGALELQYYQDFPWRASLPVWRELHGRPADEPLRAVAILRMATLEARGGNIDAAVKLLAQIPPGAMGSWRRDPSSRSATWSQMLAKRPAASSLDIDTDGVILGGAKLLDLLRRNSDPQSGDAPLRELLGLDPRDSHYRANLERMLRELESRSPPAPLRDNLQVLLARSYLSPGLRIQELRSCIERLARDPDSDALPQARYELGAALQEDKRPQEARNVYEQMLLLHPGSPWSLEAGRRLAAMGAAGRAAG